ncbi:hypothetical protein NDU88_003191 [Pleurodeles waltl]|uniref:Uncharacterized protein n=1 Tax=Pleurodeles waltl TaxID=8319 RepID=A0AAV7MD64_PLEWA|nr:hypothetical protein NDU88_003191 [Pleurodeles waltl]
METESTRIADVFLKHYKHICEEAEIVSAGMFGIPPLVFTVIQRIYHGAEAKIINNIHKLAPGLQDLGESEDFTNYGGDGKSQAIR